MKILTIFFLLLLFVSEAISQTAKDLTTAENRAIKSSKALQQMLALGTDSLPVEYLRKAKAVVVFPDLNRINILLSELVIGNGIAAIRSEDNQWSAPFFLSFKGSDINFKIAGKKSFDAVFLLMSDESIAALKKRGVGFSSGSNQKVMIGPVIKGSGTDQTMENASLIYYTLENGQIVDVNLSNDTFFKSFGILHDNNFNKAIFKMKTKAQLAAPENSLKIPAQLEKFRLILNEISSKPENPTESPSKENIETSPEKTNK